MKLPSVVAARMAVKPTAFAGCASAGQAMKHQSVEKLLKIRG
jgi:hypothetical protein